MHTGFLDREAVESRNEREMNDIGVIMTCLELENHCLSGIERAGHIYCSHGRPKLKRKWFAGDSMGSDPRPLT